MPFTELGAANTQWVVGGFCVQHQEQLSLFSRRDSPTASLHSHPTQQAPSVCISVKRTLLGSVFTGNGLLGEQLHHWMIDI